MIGEDPERLIERALRSKNRYPEELPAIVIDGSGTRSHDDFLTYKNGRLVSIMDVPALFPLNRHFIRNAFEKFANNERRIFPPEVTSRFKKGSLIPTITFETRFKPKPKVDPAALTEFETAGFFIYKTKSRLVEEFDMLTVDMQYKNPEHPITKAVSLDPDLKYLLHRRAPNRFGEDVVRESINITNNRALEWTDSKNIAQIKYKLVDGRKYFFVSDEHEPDAFVKVTNPIRNFLAFANISMISAYITEHEQVFTPEDLQRFADIANYHEQRKAAYVKPEAECYPKVTDEEISAFIDVVIRRKEYSLAKVLLAEKPTIGVLAINSIADNDQGYLLPKWDIARVRDMVVSINGKPEMHTQVIVVRGNVQLRPPTQISDTKSRTVGRVEAAQDFWKRYFKDDEFEKSYWKKQKRVEDFKKEHDDSKSEQLNGNAAAPHPRINHVAKTGDSQRKSGQR